MRPVVSMMLSVTCLALGGSALPAQEYLGKDGGLAHRLKLVDLQGGFAGFTGVQYTIDPDGSWTAEAVFNQKGTPKGKGKLSAKEVERLAAALEKYGLATLPAKSGQQPGANPHTVTVEFGDRKASLVGRAPPRLDPDNPAGTVGSRFAGIRDEVVGLLAPPAPPRKQE
jgi:hypothetical protein